MKSEHPSGTQQDVLTLLPLETSNQIISYLHASRDVAALSLSCRALHSMCNMPMRKKFHLIRVYPDDEGIEQAFGLLMRILKQPSLGQYVREIRYYGRPTHGGDWENVKKEQHSRDLSESEMYLLKGYVRRAGFKGSNENSVLNMLVQKNTGDNCGRESYFDGSNSSFRGIFIAQALAAILISVTPSLVSLAMTQPSATFQHDDRSYYPLEQFLRHANDDPDNKPYLQSLQKVYIMVDEAGELDDGRFYIHIEFLQSASL